MERIILVAADSDFVPIMKFARREGVQVVLVTMDHKLVKQELKEHADILRSVIYP
ncbi:MAG: NYN domain-containing protein [Trueperaceae bacterium]